MDIESILAPDRIFCSLQASSKKRAIEIAANKVAESLPEGDVSIIYRNLIEREKLGTTAIGQGVAIPHCRLPEIQTIIGGLFVLETPIDFSAHDEQPVNIMFVLLVPEHETTEHLKTLAMLAEVFNQESYRRALIDARDGQELYERAIKPGGSVDTKSATNQ